MVVLFGVIMGIIGTVILINLACMVAIAKGLNW